MDRGEGGVPFGFADGTAAQRHSMSSGAGASSTITLNTSVATCRTADGRL